MLGEPRQARRMFRVKRLFEEGLDVALFIAPFLVMGIGAIVAAFLEGDFFKFIWGVIFSGIVQRGLSSMTAGRPVRVAYNPRFPRSAARDSVSQARNLNELRSPSQPCRAGRR